ncbi:MAG: YggT family protein [Candidatus Aminicenantes bacterium]|nr:YggT family protein [Candidatus Aminicenantes bacterium]
MIAGNFLKALAQLIHTLIQVYIIIIIVRSLISWLGNIPPNPLTIILRKLTDPLFRFVHRVLPFSIVGGVDISPIIIVLVLYFIDNFLYSVMLGFAAQLLQKGGQPG